MIFLHRNILIIKSMLPFTKKSWRKFSDVNLRLAVIAVNLRSVHPRKPDMASITEGNSEDIAYEACSQQYSTEAFSLLLTSSNAVHYLTLATRQIQQIGYLIVYVLGILGSLLTLAVLTRPKMRNHAANFYLSFLAAANLVYAIVGISRHVPSSFLGVDITASSSATCKIWYFFIAASDTGASWTLTGIMVERCIVVVYPLKSMGRITRKSATVYMVIIGIIVVLFSSQYFVVADILYVNNRLCVDDPYPSNVMVKEFRQWLLVFFRSVVPSFVMAIANITIIVFLKRGAVKRMKLVSTNADALNSKINVTSMTQLLVATSTTFIVLSTPLHIMFLLKMVYPVGYVPRNDEEAVKNFIWSIASLLTASKHISNFPLCALSAKRFRSEMVTIFTSICGKAIHQSSKNDSSISMTNVKSSSSNVIGRIDSAYI